MNLLAVATCPTCEWVMSDCTCRENFLDTLVANIAGTLGVMQTDRVGAPAVDVDNEVIWERAAAIAQVLVLTYEIKERA